MASHVCFTWLFSHYLTLVLHMTVVLRMCTKLVQVRSRCHDYLSHDMTCVLHTTIFLLLYFSTPHDCCAARVTTCVQIWCKFGPHDMTMGWLRSVGSIKLQVTFAEYRLFYRALLQKSRLHACVSLSHTHTPAVHQRMCLWVERRGVGTRAPVTTSLD